MMESKGGGESCDGVRTCCTPVHPRGDWCTGHLVVSPHPAPDFPSTSSATGSPVPGEPRPPPVPRHGGCRPLPDGEVLRSGWHQRRARSSQARARSREGRRQTDHCPGIDRPSTGHSPVPGTSPPPAPLGQGRSTRPQRSPVVGSPVVLKSAAVCGIYPNRVSRQDDREGGIIDPHGVDPVWRCMPLWAV